MTRNAVAYSVLGAVILCLPHLAEPQSAPTPQAPLAVSIPFFVADKQGNPVRGITPADIVIRDENTPSQLVVAIRSADLPLRLAVLVDDSGSSRRDPRFQPALSAASEFVRDALTSDQDRVFEMPFNDSSFPSNWMDRNQVAHFSLRLDARGGTALLDAVRSASARMAQDATWPARRIIVLITDGDEDSSRTTREKAVTVTQDSDSVIFSVRTGSTKGQAVPHAEKLLRELSDETGGLSIVDARAQDMPRVFASIKEQIASMYVVTYEPERSGKKGHHSIEIKPASNKEWRVHAAGIR